MLGGLVLYVAGAVAALFAPTLGVMFVARFVWGLGSAGPRVAVMAMVRDAYDGEQMAKQMSFIMAVFILVPTFAPALASGLLRIGPWQIVFWLCAGCAGVHARRHASGCPRRSHADGPAGALRRRDRVAQLPRRARHAGHATGYLVALTALFGVFLSYLASSEIILDQVFGLERLVPVFFGGVSLVMGVGMYLNGTIVERIGLDRLLGRVFVVSIPAVGGHVGGFAGDGRQAAVLAVRGRAVRWSCSGSRC